MKELYGLTQLQMLEESRHFIEAEGIHLDEYYEDQELYAHCENVARIAIALGAMYRLDMHTLILLGAGGYLHDIGKSQITRKIMDKESRLSNSEHQLLQAHPTMGYRMLQQYHFPKEVADMVLYHHEKLDGGGYPTGCRDIPLTVQLLSVSDVYEAIRAKRCYHEGRTKEEALAIMEQERGLNVTAVRLLQQID